MNSWQQYILKGITFSVVLTVFGLSSFFINQPSHLGAAVSILGWIALVAAPVVLMGYLRKIL